MMMTLMMLVVIRLECEQKCRGLVNAMLKTALPKPHKLAAFSTPRTISLAPFIYPRSQQFIVRCRALHVSQGGPLPHVLIQWEEPHEALLVAVLADELLQLCASASGLVCHAVRA